MTRDEVDALITMLSGFWRHDAPVLGDKIAEDALFMSLHEVPAEDVADAVLAISQEGERFCPAPGVIFHRATSHKVVPPERAEYVPELPESTRARGRSDGTREDGGWTDNEGFQYFPDGSLDVPQLLADMRAKLAGERGGGNIDAAITQMYAKSKQAKREKAKG
jgi:hypothetical protein